MSNYLGRRFHRADLKFTASGLAAAIPSGALWFILHEAWGIQGAWVSYLSGFLFYTLFAFCYAYIDDQSTLFRSSNKRSLTKIFIVHLNYLVLLFVIIQVSGFIKPYLPDSMLAEGRIGSWYGFILFLFLGVVFFVEESWLVAKPQRVALKSKQQAQPRKGFLD
jgi:hypothetical protein